MFDPMRSALIMSGNHILGVVGEFKQPIIRNFKIPAYSAGASLKLTEILATAADITSYVPLSRYPSVSQDVSVKVNETVRYEDIMAVASRVAASVHDELLVEVNMVSIYQPSDEQSKTYSLRFKVTSYAGTLTDKEVAKLLHTFAEQANIAVKATVV